MLHDAVAKVTDRIRATWDDFAALSARVPRLVRVYPNGTADVNHVHAAAGTSVFGNFDGR